MISRSDSSKAQWSLGGPAFSDVQVLALEEPRGSMERRRASPCWPAKLALTIEAPPAQADPRQSTGIGSAGGPALWRGAGQCRLTGRPGPGRRHSHLDRRKGIGARGRLLRLLLERIESNVEVRRCVLYTARTLAIMMSPLS